ncbi:hypothetical protein TWF506_009535 [Arthrobotrys conoides]|uniref:F-box domain-containing protein n=1 Tax=Arthrobotrys conoides TaxID=74498 RepID=A0AAN8NLD1_9PEZI
MERRRRLYDYLSSTHRLDPEVRRNLRLQNTITNWSLAAVTARAGLKSRPTKSTTTLRECARDQDQGLEYTDTHHDHAGTAADDINSTAVPISGLLSLPLELHFMLLEDHFDARHHSTLAGVCKLWNHIMKTSRIARAKRYIDYHNDDRANRKLPLEFQTPDLPKDVKVHMALLVGQSQRYFFKDTTSLSDTDPSVPADAYCLGLKGEYPRLNIFAEDPLFIFPDQNSDKEYKAKHDDNDVETQKSKDKGAVEATSVEDTSISISSDLTAEPKISFSQSFIYKYQTIGMFPSLLGAGIHSSSERITLMKSSTVSDYTKALVAEMKELARRARDKRCSELSRSTSDKQIISLWERLTATDGEFLVQVNNFCMIYDGHTLNLRLDESQPCESVQRDLFFDHAVNLLDLNVLPPSRLLTRHPFSDSEDDD